MSAEAFDAAWLALRENADHRSRADGLLPPLRAWWSARGASTVLDLGCGTGSNLRYLAPKLPTPQAWTLVDHDAALLAHVEPPRPDVTVSTRRLDLAGLAPHDVDGVDLVTASALLDLVSAAWLAALADWCADAGCGALFALSYDGMTEWSAREDGPELGPDPADTWIRDAVNEHQRRDKGLGPALGPSAGAVAENLFRARGYRIWLLPSPWELGAQDAELAEGLVSGWAVAAGEERPDAADAACRWAARRRATVTAGAFRLVVGHVDLLALPVAGVPLGAPEPPRAKTLP